MPKTPKIFERESIMNKQFCPKCNAVVTDDFGRTQAFCSNCGSSASFGQTEQAFQMNETETPGPPSPQKHTSQADGKGLYYLFGCIGLLGALMVVAAAGFLGYWYWTNKDTADNGGKVVPPKSQTVRFLTAEPDSLDPHDYSNTVILNALFDGLLEYNNKNNDLAPSLAEKWEMNADATRWTFSLRKDARWSDGKPITANDFVYSWRRALNPEHAFRNAFMLYEIKNAESYNNGKGKAEEIGVRALDDFTLQVEMEKPTPYFYKTVALPAFRPVPRQAVEKHGEIWTKPENIVTSGAFKLSEFFPKDKIVVERNPMFWDNSKTKLEKIIFISEEKIPAGREYPEKPFEIYEKGEADAVFANSTPEEAIRNRKDFSVVKTTATDFIIVNTKVKPFDDVRVRRAFSLAINRDKLKQSNLTNFPTDSFLPEIKNYQNAGSGNYNPVEARRLLAEAGFPNGQNFPEFEYTYNTAQRNLDIAENVQAQWQAELNVIVKLKNMEWKEFLKIRGAAEYKGFARSGWIADYDDPLNFLNLLVIEKNGFGTAWEDKKYAEMIGKSYLETDEAKRYKMLSEAEKYLLEQQPVIPLVMGSRGILCQPYVKNLSPNPLGQINWREVFVEIN